MKKALKIALFSVLGLVVVAGVLVWMEFGSLIKGAMSCEKLDDGMYYMEYAGDDGFDELMKRGGCANINVLANYITDFLSKGHFKTAEIYCPLKPVGCSTLTVSTPDGGVMMARNFDFPYGTAMILHTQKTGGVMNEEQLTKAITSVTQLPEKGAIVGSTLWTMVMDLKHPSVTYYSRRHFDKPFHFELSQTN